MNLESVVNAVNRLKLGVEVWNDWRKSAEGDVHINDGDLSDGDYDGADFSGVTFTSTNFALARLNGAKFNGADLTNADLRDTELREAALEDVELQGADLRNADLSGADLTGANLSGAQISGARFTDCTMDDATLNGLDFSTCELSGVSFAGAKLEDTTLNGLDLNSVTFRGAKLTDSKLNGAVLSNANFRSAFLPGASFNSAHLQGVDFRSAVLKNVSFRELELSQADFRECDLSGQNFRGAELSYSAFDDSNLRDADFRGAALRGSSFRGATLISANLEDTDLEGANLMRAELQGASLHRARLDNAQFDGAKLNGANLSEATLVNTGLSGVSLKNAKLTNAELDEKSIASAYGPDIFRNGLRGGQPGVNGIWAEGSDTAALISIVPPGNSMKGSNASAVLESLRRARRLHGVSLGLALVGFGAVFFSDDAMGLDQTFRFPFLEGIEFQVDDFSGLAMLVSLGLLSLVKSFLSDALLGARYLKSRDDAMTVGTFPWAMSRYTGLEKHKRIQSLLTRFFLSFHPLLYVLFWEWGKMTELEHWYHVAPWNEWVVMPVLFALCIWIFIISQRFQRPILFDRSMEEERMTDMEALRESVERQTDVLSHLVDYVDPELSSRNTGSEANPDEVVSKTSDSASTERRFKAEIQNNGADAIPLPTETDEEPDDSNTRLPDAAEQADDTSLQPSETLDQNDDADETWPYNRDDIHRPVG